MLNFRNNIKYYIKSISEFSLIALFTTSLGVFPTQAQIINFETTPSSLTPIDNEVLSNIVGTGSYDIVFPGGITTVLFGFDTDGDVATLERTAHFEDRTNADFMNVFNTSQIAYTIGKPVTSADTDLSNGSIGGNWLIRSPRTDAEDGTLDLFGTDNYFVVQYSGDLPNSASGQLWDLDNDEIYLIEALNASQTVIGSQTLISAGSGENPGTANGKETLFSFNEIEPISFIRITGLQKGTGGGFAFDNFNATEPANETIPEPSSLLGLFVIGILGVGSAFKCRKEHNKSTC